MNMSYEETLTISVKQFIFGIFVKQITLLSLSALICCKKQVIKMLFVAYIIENLYIDYIAHL